MKVVRITQEDGKHMITAIKETKEEVSEEFLLEEYNKLQAKIQDNNNRLDTLDKEYSEIEEILKKNIEDNKLLEDYLSSQNLIVITEEEAVPEVEESENTEQVVEPQE